MLTGLLAQVMGGQVAGLVTGPAAISAALQMGISPAAIAVTVATACSTIFLTPFSHAINVLIFAPGGYRFGDFSRVGWALTILCFIMMMIGLKAFGTCRV